MKTLFAFLLPCSFIFSAATLNLGTITDLSDTTGATFTNDTAIVATGDSGQSIVIWSQAEASNVIQSSVFRSGAWVSLDDIDLGQNLLIPWVGMDASGNSIAGWSNQSTHMIQASTLPVNTNSWFSPPTDVGSFTLTARSVQVSTLPNGTTILAASLPLALPTPKCISSNLTNFATNTWSSPAVDFGGTTSGVFQLTQDPFGTAFAAITANPGTFGMYVEKMDTPTSWFLFPLFNSADSSNGSIGFDSSGNGLVLWQETIAGVTNIYYATLPFGGGAWTANPVPISAAGASLPTLGVANSGYAVAAWEQTGQIFASTYNGSTWSSPTLISDPAFTVVDAPKIAVDSTGDAVVVWGDSNDGGLTESVELGFLPFGESWQTQTITSTGIGFGITLTPRVAVSPNGTVGLSWLFTNDNFTFTEWVQALNGTIIQSTPPPPPPPPPITPPASISGVKRQNRFLFQSEFFDFIQWTASTSADVVNYKIYRNGTLIATVGSNTLSYTDHRRGKDEVDTYGVSSVNSSGEESTQITVVVQ